MRILLLFFSLLTPTATAWEQRRRIARSMTLPGLTPAPPLECLYTNDARRVAAWLAEHVPAEPCVLGFDVESVPRGHPVYPRHQGPCTVQFSTCDSSLVVHLVQPRGMASPAPLIRAVLADPTIIKVGCGVNNDVMELQSIWKGTTAQSRLDLGVLFASKGDRPGLKRLCRHIAGVELPKPLHITTSDWSRFPLSYAQVDYAARDAWAGAAMVHALQTVFPDEFATERLVELLQQNEPTIAEIQYRMRRRKQAKSLIRFLHDHYAQAAEKPQWSQELVSKLQVVVREHKHHDKVPELKLPRNLEGWTLE